VIDDEEHRFVVRHKEQLKKLRSEVDILTLTATPIPRTLNMALGGLRELSLIATPPESRLAIKTFLSTWSAQLIREACLRELKRGGQIYFVHNRIQDIASVAEQVAGIVPEGRIRIAHGQMHERDLESVMLDFYHRRFEILVCTAIIESGLDVPTANTHGNAWRRWSLSGTSARASCSQPTIWRSAAPATCSARTRAARFRRSGSRSITRC
jgi:transcription-repair coupling factor (superfamily II helicase)